MKFAERLKDHFENTPKEQLDKEWEEMKYLNEIGPDAKEYLDLCKKYFNAEKTKKIFEDSLINGFE